MKEVHKHRRASEVMLVGSIAAPDSIQQGVRIRALTARLAH